MNRLQKAALFAQIGLFLLGISGSVYAALTPTNSMLNWYSTDDAFFYFKVAQNATEGHGFTFDQINPTNGFHPLWMLCCLVVFWLFGNRLVLPLRIIILLSGLLNGLTGVILFRLLKKYLHPAAAILGAVVWMLLPSTFNNYIVQGMESALSGFFIALLLLESTSILEEGAIQKNNKLLWIGFLAALTILSRLDNLFVVGMVGFFVVFRIARVNRLVIYDMVAILLAAILAWIIRFGTTPTILNNYSIYPLMILSMFIIPVVLFLTGFYSNRPKDPISRFLVRLAVAAAVALAAVYATLLVLQKVGFNLLLSKSLVFLVVTLSMGLVALIRLLYFPKQTDDTHTPWQIFTSWFKCYFPGYLKNGVLFSIPIAVLVGSYMLLNKRMFGTYSPVSGQVKTWWGSLTNTVYQQNDTLLGLLGLTPGSGNSPWSLLTTLVADAAIFLRNLFGADSNELPVKLFILFMLIVFILLVVLLSRKNGSLARKSFSLFIPAITLGCFLQIAFYAARGYGNPRSWYWVSESLVLVLLGAVFCSLFFEKFKELTKRNTLNNILLLVMVGIVFFLHTRLLLRQFPFSVSAESEAQYLVQTRQLEESTPEGALIGMTGGGMTAYFIQGRTIVNLDGLINSVEYFDAMKSGNADDFLSSMGLDYVFGNPYMLLESNPYRDIFTDRLRKVLMIPGQDNFTLYRYLGIP